MSTRIIGIDFGTSTTVVRVHNIGAGNRIVPVSVNGQRTIPSIAFKPKNSDEIYYGYDAKAKIDSNTDGIIYKNFKMDLILEDEKRRKQAEDLIVGFLRYVYSQYQNLLNDEAFDSASEVRVYVSHPAKWNSYARSLMKQSVEKAGFCKQQNVALKDEPTAAILAVIHERNNELKQAGMLHKNRKYKAMMIDMGAGTTDIVLCTYMVKDGKLFIDDIFTYPSINAPGLCGGREIDDAIMNEAEKFIYNMQNKSSVSGDKVIKKLRRGVKEWKEKTLSPVLVKNIVLPEPDEIAGFRDTLKEFGVPVLNDKYRFSIDRKLFETFSKKHWMQWGELLKGTFTEVKSTQYSNLNCAKRPEDVELLIVTGGHSQWYIVKEFLLDKKTFFNVPSINFTKIKENPNCFIQSSDPQETVAVGLCHLDEDIVGTIAASNDVSIFFNNEDKFLGSCNLINKGVPLPYTNNQNVIKGTIDGNFIYRRELRIEYTIITDKTNKIVKSVVIPSTGIIETVIRGLLSIIGVALIDGIRIIYHLIKGDLDKVDDMVLHEIINNNYSVMLSPKIFVNEEGIIQIGGTINVDGESAIIPEIKI